MRLSKNNKIKVTPEIARIHAHICGDGSVYIINSKRGLNDLAKHKRRNIYRKEWTIEYYNVDLGLVREFVNDFKISFNRNKKTIRNKIRFRAVKYIIEMLELMNKNSYNWYIPKFIMNASKEVISNWLRAFFDDEAYIHPSRQRILLKSMNKRGLQQVIQLLKRLDINGGITGPNCDNSFYLVIKKDGICGYKDKVGFLIKRKSDLLDGLIMKMGTVEVSKS